MAFFLPYRTKHYRHNFFTVTLVIFLLFTFSLISTAQQVNGVITDFRGYWRSDSSTINAVFPNTSHNVVAFKVGNSIYATGVNNSLLNDRLISFTPGNFKALPIISITGTVPGPPIYIALASNYDGVAAGFSNTLPAVKMKDVITDGMNGLDIGTGVTNIPASAIMTFAIQSVDKASINDDKPDILYSQIADPTTLNRLDSIYFTNASGVAVGTRVTVNWSTVPSLGTYSLDLYHLRAGATCDTASITSGFAFNTTRNLRLTSFKLSDFGITAANAASIASLQVKPGGESDPAFMAYNSDAIAIISPAITTQPQTKVVCAGNGQNVTFSVTSSGTNNTYQWKKNDINIPGATGASYTINPVMPADAGTYVVVISNIGGSITSEKAYLNTVITQHPSTQTAVTGNTVTLSVSATNADSYQWKKNGADIPGATSSTYRINTLTIADNGTYTVSAINNAGNGCATVLSNPANITPVVIVYSKSTGNINIPNTWGANTDGSGSTPVDFTRAEHTFVLSNRTFGNTLTDLKIAGTLDVKDGVAVIADNTTLDVGQCIRTGNGSVSGSSSSGFTLRGNSDLFFTAGSQLLKSFSITGGTVNMLSDLTISGGTLPGKLNLTGGTLALNNNLITIQSTSTTNTSMVTAVAPTATITYGVSGAFIVERFVPGKRTYRFISPAVTTTTSIKSNWMEGAVNPDRWTNNNPKPGYGTHITGPKTAADSLDVTQTYNPSIFTFDATAQVWTPVPNSSSALSAGSPFRLMVRGSRSVDLNNNEAAPSNTIIRTTGKLTIGNHVVSAPALSTKVGGYSLVGNPYASPVNWLSLDRSGITGSYYTWDATMGGRGAYASYNATSQTNDKPNSNADKNIQSEQAFFVRSTSGKPSITFTESDKTDKNNSLFRTAETQAKLTVELLLNVEGGSNNTADGFTVVFGPNYSDLIGDEDSYKFTNLDENIAVNRRGTLLSIEGRSIVTVADTIPIRTWQLKTTDYWFKVDGKNISPSLNAILKDDYLKKDHPIHLSASTVIPFSTTADPASFAPNRFSILFESYATLPITTTKVRGYRKDKGNQVEWNCETEKNIKLYEVEKSTDGYTFSPFYSIAPKSETLSSLYSCIDSSASQGNHFYRIKITGNAGDVTYSSIVRVNIPKENAGFTIAPNPVTGNTISLRASHLEEGNYTVNIFDGAGQLMFTTTLRHTAGAEKETIALTSKIARGPYSLQLKNLKQEITRSVILQ